MSKGSQIGDQTFPYPAKLGAAGGQKHTNKRQAGRLRFRLPGYKRKRA
jgi:hypothetical protein